MTAELPRPGMAIELPDGTVGTVWATAGCMHDDDDDGLPIHRRRRARFTDKDELVRIPHADVDRLDCHRRGPDRCTPAVWAVDGRTWHRVKLERAKADA